MQTGEALELVERAHAIEGLGIHLDRGMRGVATGATSGMLLQVRGMRCAICAQEELGTATRSCLQQRLAMLLALQNRQAVIVRTNASRENRIAVEQQMLRGDGGAGIRIAGSHVLRGLPGGDVLEHDLQTRKVTAQRDHLLFNEHGFAVEQIDIAARHLAMHQQQQAVALHGFERGVDFADVGNACVAVGGGTGRIELAGHNTSRFGSCNLIRCQIVGEVQRHQRLELRALGHSSQNALLVGQHLFGRRNRWAQVGHDDGTAKLRRSMRHHGFQRIAITQVNVPVVGPEDGKGLDRGHSPIVSSAWNLFTMAATHQGSPMPFDPRTAPLTAIEARVLATLMEKARTVPDSYPLTLNALVTGCNQKSSRDPVMEVTEGEAVEALDQLRQRSLAVQISGNRAMRWEHNFPRGVGVPDQSAVLLALLMLRGPQTAGELRINAERWHRFADISSVEAFLDELRERHDDKGGPLVAQLPRAPGAREQRWAQLLCGPIDLAALQSSANTLPVPSALQQRVETLEAEVAQLRATVRQLCEALGVDGTTT